MARYTGPVCRLCRREKMKLFLKGPKCDTMKCPINGRRVDIPSYRVKKGDTVALKERSREMIVIRHNVDTLDRQVPPWLEAAPGGFEVAVRDLPLREHIDVPVREQLIVELYSK